MKKFENGFTYEDAHRLAEHVVTCMDLDDIILSMIETIEYEYLDKPELFYEDLENYGYPEGGFNV